MVFQKKIFWFWIHVFCRLERDHQTLPFGG